MNKRIAVITVAVMLVFGLAACGQERKDLEGIPSTEPEKIQVYVNVDQHPNIARVCVGGVGFATTTRQYGDAVIRVPEWDAWCRG